MVYASEEVARAVTDLTAANIDEDVDVAVHCANAIAEIDQTVYVYD